MKNPHTFRLALSSAAEQNYQTTDKYNVSLGGTSVLLTAAAPARLVLGSTALTLAGSALAPALAKTPADQLVVGVSLAQVLSLDPGQATEPGAAMIQANTYDRLVTTDDNDPTKVLPQLAERWEATPDGITFHLRAASFMSGNPVTAVISELASEI